MRASHNTIKLKIKRRFSIVAALGISMQVAETCHVNFPSFYSIPAAVQ